MTIGDGIDFEICVNPVKKNMKKFKEDSFVMLFS